MNSKEGRLKYKTKQTLCEDLQFVFMLVSLVIYGVCISNSYLSTKYPRIGPSVVVFGGFHDAMT